jgi:DNA repair protein RecO (recombination protein O)
VGVSFTASGLVLQTRKYREQDQWIEVLTPNKGKISLLAKGVRKITSRRAAALQPGTLIRFHWLELGETRLLTEVKLEENFLPVDHSLTVLRDISAVLEIVFHISLGEIEQEDLFTDVQDVLRYIRSQGENYERGVVRQGLFSLLARQGIVPPEQAQTANVTDLIEQVLGRPVHSFAFLHI